MKQGGLVLGKRQTLAAARDFSRWERIRSLVPLNTLADDKFTELLSSIAIERIGAGGLVFSAGDVDQRYIYLLSGVLVLLQSGREVDRVSADTDLARYPLAHQFPRKHSARALGQVTLLRLDNRVVSRLMSCSTEDGYQVEEVSLGAAGDWLEQLLGSRVLQLMPNANLEQVLRNMERVNLTGGKRVFSQGDAGDYYYFISRGQCRLTRSVDGGPPEEVARLGPGASFGEDALLSGSPRSCTIDMLSDGVLIRLSKENFERLIKPSLSREVGYHEAQRRVAGGAVWIDVRDPDAHAGAGLEGSIKLPFDLLRYQMDSLAPDREYIVYCDDGSISTAAAYLLAERGFSVAVLKRGLRGTGAAKPSGGHAPALGKPQMVDTAARSETASDDSVEPDEPSAPAIERLAQSERDLAQARGLAEELQRALDQSQTLYREQERRHALEVRRLKQALKTAREAKANTDLETRNQQLRKTLTITEDQLRSLATELESVEDRHILETEEMHQLWEKRLHQLEKQLEQARVERDEWCRRSQDKSG